MDPPNGETALIHVSTQMPLQAVRRTTRGPSAVIANAYDEIGLRVQHGLGKACRKFKIGPEFPTRAIELIAFNVDAHIKLKRLCDIYGFYGSEPPSRTGEYCDWEIEKLIIYCLRLLKYASPNKTEKTQLETFKFIIRLTTFYPGIRLVFLKDASLHNINVDEIWKRKDDDYMDEEWRLFRRLAASCIGNGDCEVIQILQKVRPNEFGKYQEHSEGTVEELLTVAVDATSTPDVQRMTAVRYLAGILRLPVFWEEIQNRGQPAEKLLKGVKRLIEDFNLDPSSPNTSRRELRNIETEGIDLLVEAVVNGLDSWAVQMPDTLSEQDATIWAEIAFQVLDLLRGPEAMKYFHKSNIAAGKAKALYEYQSRLSTTANLVPVTSYMQASVEMPANALDSTSSPNSLPPSDDSSLDNAELHLSEETTPTERAHPVEAAGLHLSEQMTPTERAYPVEVAGQFLKMTPTKMPYRWNRVRRQGPFPTDDR